MDYLFDTVSAVKTVRVQSDAGTNLHGCVSVVEEHSTVDIMHSFRVLSKIHSKEGPDGKHYDWYEIDQYYRDTRTKAKDYDGEVRDLETALCETDSETDSRISALENALCELDARLNGGENG